MSRRFWIVTTLVWLAAAIAACIYRNMLMASVLGKSVLIALGLPLAIALYLAVEALGEGIVLILLLAAFKVVTVGLIRTEFTAGSLAFPWHGFARGGDGRLVASEGAMAVIGVMVYVAVGVCGYFWFS